VHCFYLLPSVCSRVGGSVGHGMYIAVFYMFVEASWFLCFFNVLKH